MKTDAELKSDIIAELSWESSINADRITVNVVGGVVTLEGEVYHYADKWHAETAASHVSGVLSLVDHLQVKLAFSSQRKDGDIEQAARAAMAEKDYLADHAVDVSVDNGWLVLSGELEHEYQKQSATYAVRYLTGIKGISNEIVVRPALSVRGVQADIEKSLKRRAIEDAHEISVTVDGMNVTLAGTVATWPERALAQSSAWHTHGVQHVVNNIIVVPPTSA
ncbi:BON domain-containing protein [Pseudomonas sp. RIT-To-2]|uniref:BON domain-containing protein n=1 Tax=Pseudomonas sp. RIT-To-2 TaxID=3462541 RepID=UPI0024131865